MGMISREAALDAIDKNRQDLLSLGMDGAEHILVHYGRRVIEGLPTASEVTLCHPESPCEYQNADIAMPTIDPVKHGRWETEVRTIQGYKIPFFACSNCGKNAVEEYRYCPNCGARMEGGEDERTD